MISDVHKVRYLISRAGIRLKLSKGALIKVVYYCIRIDKKFVRKNSDFHAYDLLSLEVLKLTGLRAWPS